MSGEFITVLGEGKGEFWGLVTRTSVSNQTIPGLVQLAIARVPTRCKFSHVGDAHISVAIAPVLARADDVSTLEAHKLALTGGLDVGSDEGCEFADAVAGEFVRVHSRDIDFDVDAIRQMARDAFLLLVTMIAAQVQRLHRSPLYPLWPGYSQ